MGFKRFYNYWVIKEQTNSTKPSVEELVNMLSGGEYTTMVNRVSEVYNYIRDGIEVTLKDPTLDGRVADVLLGHQVTADVEIDAIVNHDKGTTKNGMAGKELKRILELVDEHDMSVSLGVDAAGAGAVDGDLTDKQLIRWYKRNGFFFDYGNSRGYRPSKNEATDKFENITSDVLTDEIKEVFERDGTVTVNGFVIEPTPETKNPHYPEQYERVRELVITNNNRIVKRYTGDDIPSIEKIEKYIEDKNSGEGFMGIKIDNYSYDIIPHTYYTSNLYGTHRHETKQEATKHFKELAKGQSETLGGGSMVDIKVFDGSTGEPALLWIQDAPNLKTAVEDTYKLASL